jgi:hypothetical protein
VCAANWCSFPEILWILQYVYQCLCHSCVSNRNSYTKHLREQPSARGCNWAALSPGDINTGTWPSRLGESQMRQ